MKRLATLVLSMATLASAATISISFTTLPTHTANGYYVGITGAVEDGNPIAAICDDFEHTTYVPSGPYTYYESSLPDLANVRFTGQANYEVAALLFDALLHAPDSMAGSYQFALWSLFTPAAGTYGDSAALLAQAQALQASGGHADVYSRFRVYTPTEAVASNQEWLGFETPEPGAFLLVGAGLLVVARRRRG